MALTPEIRTTLGRSYVASVITPDLRVTLGRSLVAINFPTEFARITQGRITVAALHDTVLDVTQARVQAAITPDNDIRVVQARVLAAVKGRTANHRVRAWTFSLDGHDFYVLRLGMTLTLVYDVYSEQWMDWDAFSQEFWPVNCGINWVGGVGLLDADGNSYGSNVLVGDDSHGLLWFLDPELPYDESPVLGDPVEEYYFERVIQGQVPMNGREVLPCFTVWLTTDMGEPAYLGAGVTLEISDDAGKTYDDMGTVTVTAGENSPELAWYSLGQIQAPGRLFRITDDGAVARIDNMEMNDPDDE